MTDDAKGPCEETLEDLDDAPANESDADFEAEETNAKEEK